MPPPVRSNVKLQGDLLTVKWNSLSLDSRSGEDLTTNRFKFAFAVASSLWFLFAAAANAQSREQSSASPQIPAVTVRSNLVLVPALVKNKAGEAVFSLTAKDFILTDNGVPQSLELEPDTDSQPLALAIIVQTGGLGASHLPDYSDLGAVLDAVIGNVPHRVAVIPASNRTSRLIRMRPPRRLPHFTRVIRAPPFLTRSISALVFCANSRQPIAVPCCFAARQSTAAAKQALTMPFAQSTTQTPRFIASAFRARKQRWSMRRRSCPGREELLIRTSHTLRVAA